MASNDIVPLSRFHAVLARPRGKKRLAEIFDQPNPAAVVQAMEVQDLYFLIAELGIADSTELIALASGTQVQGMFDIDVWERDRIVPTQVAPWLAALVSQGPAHLGHIIERLDPEFAALMFAKWTQLYELVDGRPPDDVKPPFFETPDGFYVVEIVAPTPEQAKLVRQALDYLYRADQALARHVLRAAATEGVSYLEETSYRFRSGRMQDMGYADYDQALDVYQPIDIDSVRTGSADAPTIEEPSALPPVLAEATLKKWFLGKVLDRIVDSRQADHIESSLMLLINRVLSADRVPPGIVEAVTDGTRRAAATLSLGLETVARGDVERGAEAITRIALTRLHRVGVTVLAKLAQLVVALGERAERTDPPMSHVVAAIGSRRPMYPLVLDSPPAQGVRLFAELADVTRASDALHLLAMQSKLVYEKLGQDPAALGPHATVSAVGKTAVVLAALGKPLTPLAVTTDDVLLYCQTMLKEGATIGAATTRSIKILGAEYADVIASWLADLEQNLGGLDSTAAPERKHLPNLVFTDQLP